MHQIKHGCKGVRFIKNFEVLFIDVGKLYLYRKSTIKFKTFINGKGEWKCFLVVEKFNIPS